MQRCARIKEFTGLILTTVTLRLGCGGHFDSHAWRMSYCTSNCFGSVKLGVQSCLSCHLFVFDTNSPVKGITCSKKLIAKSRKQIYLEV